MLERGADGASPEMDGFLSKLKQNPRPGCAFAWSRRLFQIRGGFLLYFRSRTSRRPAGWLRLAQVTRVEPIPADERVAGVADPMPHTFTVALRTRMLYLHASSDDERAAWMSGIERASRRVQGSRAPLSRRIPSASVIPIARVRDGEVGEGSGPTGGAGHMKSDVFSTYGSPPRRRPIAATTPGFFAGAESGAAGSASPLPGSPAPPAAASPKTPASAHPDATASTPVASETPPGAARWALGQAFVASFIPRIDWVRRLDAASGVAFFVDAATGMDAFWELPPTDSPGGWAVVWDEAIQALFYVNTRTGECSFGAPGADITEHPAAQAAVNATSGGATYAHQTALWLEQWSAEYSAPYYSHVTSGLAQWEYPADPAAVVIQADADGGPMFMGALSSATPGEEKQVTWPVLPASNAAAEGAGAAEGGATPAGAHTYVGPPFERPTPRGFAAAAEIRPHP